MLRFNPNTISRAKNRFLFHRNLHSSSFSKGSQTLETEEQSYASQLRQCTEALNTQLGKSIHAQFIKRSLLSSLYLHNHLLNMYVKCGDFDCGLNLFDEMPYRNVVSWTVVISGLVQHGYAEKGLLLFRRLHLSGVAPNEFTLVGALNACSLSGNISQAYQIFGYIVRLGFENNVFLFNAFLTALIRHCKLAAAVGVFEKCSCKDIVSWNAIIAGYLQFSYAEVPRFWVRLVSAGVKPDNFTFASVLTGLAALSDLELGLQVHAQLVKYGHGVEICVGNSLVDMYLKNHKLVDGFKAFNEMTLKDVISWTQIAAGCLLCGEPERVLGVIGQMKKEGLMPNKFTLGTALNALANLASLEEGEKVHALKIKLGSDMDLCVDNALLDMYAKCGCMDSALAVFKRMEDRSVVSWTTMIMGFAQNGEAKKGIEFFEDMKLEAVEPNLITFVCVLYACSQGGFVNEGWKYFSSMTKDHGITPGDDHYACMVDLLGRAGQIKEAEELILGMPFQPSVLVWQTLLGACKVHGDIETGMRAAEHALHLDKSDPSTYVLLSNIFANSDDWVGVRTLRELMEARQVRKMPGSSWMEINGNCSLAPADGAFFQIEDLKFSVSNI